MSFEFKIITKDKVDKVLLYELYQYLISSTQNKNIEFSNEVIFITNNDDSKWKYQLEIFLIEEGLFFTTILNRKERENFVQLINNFFKSHNIEINLEEE